MRPSFVHKPLFWLSALSILLGAHSFAAVGKKCLDPLLEAIDHAERTGKKPFTTVIQAPVECQYFQVNDLDDRTQERILALVKAQGKTMSLETKLTAVFGLIKLTPRNNASIVKKRDPCEDLFFDLAQ